MPAPIARYFATLGISVDKKSVVSVDKTLDRFERKLRSFGKLAKKNLKLRFDIDKFNIDQKALNLALERSMAIASSSTVFEVSRFSINDRALRSALLLAMHRQPPLTPTGASDLRRDIRTGGAAGVASRAYMPLLGAVAGGYGLGAVNRRNQEVVSAQLMTQAVVQQAGGTVAEGTQSFDWLRSQANRVGFDYLEAAPDFSKLLAGLTGAGMSVETGQQTFKGFAELARTNKLDKVSQNRLFRALSQVAGKDQLLSEELTGQIAEALPGGVALFAEAWQRKTGGSLTGKDAIKALRAAMKNNEVKGDILPIAGMIASERASVGLSAASKASQAEQARFRNALNDQAIVASQAGVESGFSKIFRALAIGLNESTALTRTLAESFDSAATFAEKLILFPQSFARALDGRDSLVADWLGVGATEQLREDWSTIQAAISNIFSNTEPEWMVTFKSTAQEIAMLLGKLAEFQQFTQRTGSTAEQIISDEYYAGGGSTQAQVKGILKANWHTFKSLFAGSSDVSAEYMAQREADSGGDISPYMGERGFNPDKYWEAAQRSNKEQASRQFGANDFGISQTTAGTYIAEVKNNIEINVPDSVMTVEGMREYFRTEFVGTLGTALMEFPNTGN